MLAVGRFSQNLAQHDMSFAEAAQKQRIVLTALRASITVEDDLRYPRLLELDALASDDDLSCKHHSLLTVFSAMGLLEVCLGFTGKVCKSLNSNQVFYHRDRLAMPSWLLAGPRHFNVSQFKT